MFGLWSADKLFFLVDNSVVIIMVDLNFWKFFFKTLKDVSGTTNTFVIFSNAALKILVFPKKKKKKSTVSEQATRI